MKRENEMARLWGDEECRPSKEKWGLLYPFLGSGVHLSRAHWVAQDIFGKFPFISFLPFSIKHLALTCFLYHICHTTLCPLQINP